MASDGAAPAPGRGGPEANSRRTGGPLGRLAEATTLLAGVVLVAMAILVVTSVAGRYLFNAPLVGDYEIVEMAGAVAVFLCFPYTHLTGSNIVAEFFTTALPARVKLALDTVHELIFALVAGLFTWRLALGGLHKHATNDTTALLALPVWAAYVVAVAAMALLCVVCLRRLADGIARLRR
jgi:TRAP-type C4-dicarboxylate transport system permease small subunit